MAAAGLVVAAVMVVVAVAVAVVEVAAVAVAAIVAAFHLCLQDPLGLAPGPPTLAFHQA